MNIHRELAIYRLFVVREHEAIVNMREEIDAVEENGDTDRWQLYCEQRISLAMGALEREQRNKICEAFEDKEDKGSAP